MPYVTETIWLEKLNNLIGRLVLNGYKSDKVTMERALRLMKSLSDEYMMGLYEKYETTRRSGGRTVVHCPLFISKPISIVTISVSSFITLTFPCLLSS